MGYLLNRSSTFNPIMRYFSSQIINLVNTKKWWGPGTKDSATDDIRPYNITFSEELVKDLKYKLRNSEILKRSDKYIEGDINMYVLSKLLHKWAYDYDFQEREKYINSFPHFMTNIHGLDIHFVHVKRYVEERNMKKNRMPLLLLHGWPKSVMEFYKDISFNKLIKEREIIIPSLPGFGFSSAPTVSGFTCIDTSVVLKNLMLRLGHDKFHVKDGTCGANTGHIMSILFPQQVNDDLNKDKHTLWDEFASDIDEEAMPIAKYIKEFANNLMQASEVNTSAIGLNDLPDALAAYFIEEIFRTDPMSLLKKQINLNTEMIDNLMMYWAPQCIYRAMQVYTEQFNGLPSEFYDLLYDSYENH